MIKINQNALLKPYIDTNTDLRKKVKNDFGNNFCKLMNNAVFRKTIENVRKHKDIKHVTTKRRRIYLVKEPDCHTTNFFSRKSISNRNKKTDILMNKRLCLVLSILELRKTLMYQFWYDYIKPKYGEKVKLRYMDTGVFHGI